MAQKGSVNRIDNLTCAYACISYHWSAFVHVYMFMYRYWWSVWPIDSHMTIRREVVDRCWNKWGKKEHLDKQNMRTISSLLIDLFESASEKKTEDAGNQKFPTVEAMWSISVQRERNVRLPELSSWSSHFLVLNNLSAFGELKFCFTFFLFFFFMFK